MSDTFEKILVKDDRLGCITSNVKYQVFKGGQNITSQPFAAVSSSPTAVTFNINVPSLETRSKYPSSLSTHIVTDILRNSLGFNGLIISDALNMKGAADFDESGEIDLAAFLAGNDILLISEDPPTGIAKIMNAYYNGKITEERLEYSVKKILKAKFKVGDTVECETNVTQYKLDDDNNWVPINKLNTKEKI